MAKFSQRSKDALVGVADPMVRLMNAAIIDTPVDFTVIEGVRTAKTQATYYTWGRSVVNPNTGPIKGKPLGSIVTTRDGVTKKSEHQVKADGKGHAVDVCPFLIGKDGKGFLAWNDGAAFKKLAAHIKKTAKRLGIKIIWGGDWVKLRDLPHYELA